VASTNFGMRCLFRGGASIYTRHTILKFRTKFQKCTKLIDAKIKKYLKNRENSKLKNVKSKYKYVGSFLKAKNTPIPSIKTNDSKTLISKKEKAEHIAKFFEGTFSSKTANLHHFSSRLFHK
jgi:hypothetical protein